jgi:pilus assembly protein CpaB
MRPKSIVLVVLALGCGLVAAIGINQVMDARTKEVDQADKQPIFVAMTDVNANDELTAQNLKLEEWPKNIIPPGALTKLEDVEGKRCRVKIFAGEPILSSKLLGENESLGAAKEIPEGMRVVHVKVDPVTGSSNLILPGDRVDVLVFRPPGNDLHVLASKIVLQDIKVFAVDTHTETEYSRTKSDQSEPITAKTIALLVTPPQSEVLHAATEIGGSVRLVLRNPEDNEQVVAKGATVGDVFGSDSRNPNARRDDDDGKSGKIPDAWLNQLKDKVPPAAPQAPPVPAAALPQGPPRRMIVVFGSELQQVDFSDDGQPLSNPFQKDGPKFGGSSSPTLLTGEGDQAPAGGPTDDEGDKDTDKDEDFISPN